MIANSSIPGLRIGGKLPLFYLPSLDGGKSGPAAMRSKYNLVLVFLPTGSEAVAYLQEIAAHYPDILRNDTRVIAVLDTDPDNTRRAAEALELPFMLLADTEGATASRILGELNHAGLIATDRFGIIYFAEAAATISALPTPRVILDWLDYIEIQCPECTDANASPWLSEPET